MVAIKVATVAWGIATGAITIKQIAHTVAVNAAKVATLAWGVVTGGATVKTIGERQSPWLPTRSPW